MCWITLLSVILLYLHIGHLVSHHIMCWVTLLSVLLLYLHIGHRISHHISLKPEAFCFVHSCQLPVITHFVSSSHYTLFLMTQLLYKHRMITSRWSCTIFGSNANLHQDGVPLLLYFHQRIPRLDSDPPIHRRCRSS